MNGKTVLFISGLDYKRKSIQVIRHTPEHYAAAGYTVVCVVARDISRHGNYYYEDIADPAGARAIHRIYWPFTALYDSVRNRFLRLALSKLRGLAIVFMLAWKASRVMRTLKVDILYGYEVHGVLARLLLDLLGMTRGVLRVSRFQGTLYFGKKVRSGKILPLLANFDAWLAHWAPSDICVMTNDGTRGIETLELIGSRSLSNAVFLTNGVDIEFKMSRTRDEVRRSLGVPLESFLFCSINRLSPDKRVDRSLYFLKALREVAPSVDWRFVAVGEGALREQLQALASSLGIQNKAVFAGSVVQSQVYDYLNAGDAFLSMYDESNVGNPLLEAINFGIPIFTLDVGDTKEWIADGVNGFIYSVDDALIQNMVRDAVSLVGDTQLRQRLLEGLAATRAEKLHSWKRRFELEIEAVEKAMANSTKRVPA